MVILIRVLHVLGALNRGGAETVVMNLYRNIDRNKLQFDFIIHTEDDCDYSDEIKSLGGKIYSIPKYTGKNHFQYKNAWKVFFRDHGEYKLIHGHVRSTASIYLKIAKDYGLTTISHSHSTSSGKGLSASIKDTLQYPIRHIADYLFACSRPAGIWLFGKKACQKENFYVLNNAIDAKKFIFNKDARINIRKEFSVENKIVIGHVGRFSSEKNHTFLIEVFEKIYNKNKNTILMLVGTGGMLPQIKNKVSELGLTDGVIFTGVRPDIPELLHAMDVFVFPSLFEGLGMVAIEAQASGLNCVVADTIPNEAFITDLIKSVPLSSSVDIWANKILGYSAGYERRDTYDEICNKGYDIAGNSKWLEDFYVQKSYYSTRGTAERDEKQIQKI